MATATSSRLEHQHRVCVCVCMRGVWMMDALQTNFSCACEWRVKMSVRVSVYVCQGVWLGQALACGINKILDLLEVVAG